MPYQNQFPNIYGKKLHQIFHQVRIELLPSSLFWRILRIPQHYSASNYISRWLPTVTRVFMPNLDHSRRAPVTTPASSMWPVGPLVAECIPIKKFIFAHCNFPGKLLLSFSSLFIATFLENCFCIYWILSVQQP